MPTDKSGKWIPLKFKYSDNSTPDVKDNSIKTPQDNQVPIMDQIRMQRENRENQYHDSVNAVTDAYKKISPQDFMQSMQANNDRIAKLRTQYNEGEGIPGGSQQPEQVAKANEMFSQLPFIKEAFNPLMETMGTPNVNPVVKGTSAMVNALLGGVMSPYTEAMDLLNKTGKVGKEISQGLNQAMNIPFEAVRTASQGYNELFKGLGIKLPDVVNPETDKALNDLIQNIGTLYLMGRGHEAIKDYVNKQLPAITKLSEVSNENQNNATSSLSNEQGKSAQTGSEGQTKVGTPLGQSENIQPEQAPQNAEGINSNVSQVGKEGTGVENLDKGGIPLMITKKMESDLKDLGYSQSAINKMKPQEAVDYIKNKFRPPEEEKVDLGRVPKSYQEAVLQYLVRGGKIKPSADMSIKDLRDMGLSNRNISKNGQSLDLMLTQLGFGDLAHEKGLSEKDLVLDVLRDHPDHQSRMNALRDLQIGEKQKIDNPEELDRLAKQREEDYNKLDDVILNQYMDADGNLDHKSIVDNSEEISKKTGVDEGAILRYMRDVETRLPKPEEADNYFNDFGKEIPIEKAKQIINNADPEEYGKLAEDINGKANSNSEEQRNEAIRQADEAINKVNEPQEEFNAETPEVKPGEQIKMQGLGQAKMPEGFINKEGGKGEETTPLFNQKTEDKNQGNIFGDLQSTPIPGLKEFAEQDLSKVSEGIKSGVNYLRKTFLPSSWGKEGKLTAMLSRVRIAELTRAREQTLNAFKQARDYFDKKSNADNLKLIDGAEKGKYEGNPNESKIMQHMQELLNEKYQYILNTYKAGAGSFIENYFPHFWKDPEKAKAAFSDTFKKSNLEGQKGFLKERTIPLTMDGIAKGLEPVSYNPTELFLAKMHEMDKYIMAQDLKGDFKKNGLIKFAKLGDQPSGWKPLNDPMGKVFQYSEKEKGLIYRGNYYMPEKAANIVNNYLSPGLQNNPFYSVLRQSGNLLNQFQLGLSGFHAFFTTQDVMISKMALGIQQFSQGRFGESLKSLADVPLSPVTNFIKGNELMKDYYSKNPIMTKAIDNLMRAGGRAKMDSFYYNKAVQGWMKAWRSGNPIGGVLRTPGALIETLAKPLMQDLVPRQKLGVFFDLAENINKEAARKGLDWKQETALLQEAWDSVDNRMGQMTYDNLFWNKTLKDLSMGSVRSVGWNIGDLREIGGAPIDLGKQIYGAAKGQGFRVTPKMAYVLALPIISGMIGAITNYLYTGQPPKELKDYYFPRTGKMNADGTPERISIPGYMRDVWAYSIRPISTIVNKLHPLISDVIQMLNNKDYYGYEIVDPDDPLIRKVGEWASYVGTSAMPFSIQGMQKRAEAGEGLGGQLQSFVGMNPASKYISNTSMQNDIEELYSKQSGQGVKPYSAQESAKVRRDILQAYKNKDNKKAAELIRQALKDKTFTRRQITDMVRSRNVPVDVWMFKGLRKEYKERLAKKMSAEEKKKYGVKENQ